MSNVKGPGALLNHGSPSGLPEQHLGFQTPFLVPVLIRLSCRQMCPAWYPVRKGRIGSSLALLQRRGSRGLQSSKAI